MHCIYGKAVPGITAMHYMLGKAVPGITGMHDMLGKARAAALCHAPLSHSRHSQHATEGVFYHKLGHVLWRG
jgi:hypothetical protein